MSEVDGGYFCTQCQAFVDVIDADEHNQRCVVCKSYRVKWCPGSVDRGVRSAEQKAAEVKRVREASERFEAGVMAGMRVKFTPEFLERKPRLSAAERDLRLLAQSGYYFCFGCLEISKKAEGKCVLCGSEDVKWQGGIENVPEPAAANNQSPIASSQEPARCRRSQEVMHV